MTHTRTLRSRVLSAIYICDPVRGAEVSFAVDGKFVQEFITNPLLLGGRLAVTGVCIIIVGVATTTHCVSVGSLTLVSTLPSPPLTL